MPSGVKISNSEFELKSKLNNKYIPDLYFDGRHECFVSTEENIDIINSLIPQS